jgi:IS30 family transposase
MFLKHPYSSREGHFCENANGLLRRMLPKGTDLGIHSHADLDAIALQQSAELR